MKRLLTPIIPFIVLLPGVTPAVFAQTIYTHADSLWISRRLHEPVEASSTAELFLSVARQFLGKPYVAHTLDRNEYEKLVVDVQGVDCTTFIEYALALTFCLREGQTDFGNFLDYLRDIRYADGEVSYTARNHYFTVWTENNIGKGFVEPVKLPPPPLSAIRRLQTDYMSTHVSSYAMLNRHREWLPGIIRMEKSITGRQMQYIPKAKLNDHRLLRGIIRDGDIIVIVTNKKGLDTSHIGIAVWQGATLHLLNASQVHKKVVIEPLTLYRYMQKHPSQIGISVVRVRESSHRQANTKSIQPS